MHQESESLDNTLELVKHILVKLSVQPNLFPTHWQQSKIHLIGVAVWDIFSNNHQVISTNNQVYDLGSWRVSGDHIAELIEANFKDEPFYDYMDFYKGSSYQLETTVDLIDLYEAIFKILKSKACDWNCASSKLSFFKIQNNPIKDGTDSNLNYDPNQAFAEDFKEMELEIAKGKLADAYKKAIKNIKKVRTVEAYMNVYHKIPNEVNDD